MNYDENNIFAKIIRKELFADIIFEDENVICLKDIKPRAPVHILVIPKGSYTDYSNFIKNATDKEILSYFKAIGKISEDFELDKKGYRIISNIGDFAGQEVPHFHCHVLGGSFLGNMINK